MHSSEIIRLQKDQQRKEEMVRILEEEQARKDADDRSERESRKDERIIELETQIQNLMMGDTGLGRSAEQNNTRRRGQYFGTFDNSTHAAHDQYRPTDTEYQPSQTYGNRPHLRRAQPDSGYGESSHAFTGHNRSPRTSG
jgi:hypothetical protein